MIILGIAFLGLSVLLWAGTMFFQGYIYSEPVTGSIWRAPLAALILIAFTAFWCSLAYRNPGRYNTLFQFSSHQDQNFDKFWSVKKGKEILYVAKHNAKGRMEYRDPQGKPWSRSDSEGVMEAIIVEDQNGDRIRFETEMTPDGKFKTIQGESIRYVETGGRHRVMTEDYIGKLTEIRWGALFANIFLNFLHVLFWFACLWLLLQYQWSHALGLAIIIWLVATLTLLPMLFKKSEDLSAHRQATAQRGKREEGLGAWEGTGVRGEWLGAWSRGLASMLACQGPV